MAGLRRTVSALGKLRGTETLRVSVSVVFVEMPGDDFDARKFAHR